MKKSKKKLRQLIVAFLLLYTIGIPIKNIVLANANELSTTEEVITEEVEINEDKTIASEEAEQPTKEIQEEKEISEESTSAVAENAPSEQPPAEEMIDSKEEVKKSNQPVEAEKTIKKNVKAISPDKISVIFPDAALAEIIRDTLGKSSVDDIVTQAELDTITWVSEIYRGIADISGMENLTSLTYLNLDNDQISDISPLANLTNLEYLYLNYNQISDISPLANLINLTNLSLGRNQISDISPLANLTNLIYLNLYNNQISDLTPLSNLTNLISLQLDNNQISDLTPLSNLTLLTLLYLDNQSISASKVKWNDPLSVTNAIKDLNGNLIAPSSISNQGSYTNQTITWTGLTNAPQSVSYSWSQSVIIGNIPYTFSGTFNLPVVEKSAQYNLFFDIDGQVTTELVEVGELVTKPQDPNKDGYAFIGWYDTETGGNKWDFSTDTMPANDMTLYARFNKLGFVTPEIKPSIPTVVTPITPGVDPVTPSVEPPTTPGNRPNPVIPPTPGTGENQIPSNGSGLNTGNMTENTKTSPEASQQNKLANLGEQNSMILQGVGLLMVISGIAFFWWKRRKYILNKQNEYINET
ncbi:TPA_asm: LPXTG cell wall anchor domain-containing protein, partial [Listeria monocytogenes]|nr:LPXTG cell wall anchor domain-containing protein [Listeria monocytogenes]